MELTFTPPAPTRAFSHEQVARNFFVRLLDNNDESTGQWRCKICTRSYRQDDGRGYSNLIVHLRARHPTSRSAYARRRNTKLALISHVTMRDNILHVAEEVEDKVAQDMPDNFGIIFDGWSNDSEHYLAVFPTYEVDGLVKTPLLSMAPIVNEPDDNLKAESHHSALESVLAVFGKEVVHCLFLCKQEAGLPHERTACRVCIPPPQPGRPPPTADFQAELDLIQKLMVRLRTLSQAAKLRCKTHLRPGLRQDTRWGSTFCILARFFEIREHLDADDEAIEDLLPFPSTTKKLKALLVKMKMVESVPKRIQSSDESPFRCSTAAIPSVREISRAFRGNSSATIGGDPYFESAVVKLQRGRPLGRQEKAAVSVLKVASGGPSADNLDDGFAERVLKRARVFEQTDKYILAAAILPTSNIVERLFNMDRAMLFLKVNISYWDVNVVRDILETEQR
ncbi:Ribonuclease H-like domain [Phytophthora cactorum]|nr:Ribonuclease H-like domain [Phytophthora cactorum]